VSPRRLRWDLPESSPPAHPYRDTALVYGVLAAIVVLVAWLTGGPVGKAVVLAVLVFVVACGWSWSRWRQRLARSSHEAGEDPR
jgi:hypothetical protein